MTLARSYEIAKIYLLHPLLLPLAVMVGVDYISALGLFIKLVAFMYMLAWWLAALVGVWVGLMTRLKPESPWGDIFKYRAGKLVPSIKWGHDLTHWLLSTNIPAEVSEDG